MVRDEAIYLVQQYILGHLWYRELCEQKSPPRDLILKGTSIISMKTRQNNIELRDFLQVSQCAHGLF